MAGRTPPPDLPVFSEHGPTLAPLPTLHSSLYESGESSGYGSVGSGGVRLSLQERRAAAAAAAAAAASGETASGHPATAPGGVFDSRRSSLALSRASTQLSLDFSPDGGPGCLAPYKPEVVADVAVREFWETPDGKDLPHDLKHPKEAVKVMSYNILADRYNTSGKYGAHCPIECLGEEYRLRRIVAEVRKLDPDVIVFEEVSSSALERKDTGLTTALGALGYKGRFHVPVTLASERKARDGSNIMRIEWRTGGDPERPEIEGVAIFWRTSRYYAQETMPLWFNRIAQQDRTLPLHEKARVCGSSHNVAAVVVLRSVANQDEVLLVAGTHAYYDSSKPDVQVYQMARMLQTLQSIRDQLLCAGGTVNVVVAGDFNATLDAPSVQFALNGRLMGAFPMEAVPVGDTGGATHTLGLRAAYGEYAPRHPSHVSQTGPNAALIDHIFYEQPSERGGMVCTAVLRLTDNATGTGPTPEIPSDHLPILAVLVPTSAFA